MRGTTEAGAREHSASRRATHEWASAGVAVVVAAAAAQWVQFEVDAEPKERRSYCALQLFALGLHNEAVDDNWLGNHQDARQVQVMGLTLW